MRISRIALLLVHAFVASRLASGAAVDRHDSERHHTAVINLLDTRNDRIEEEDPGVAWPTAEYDSYDEQNYIYDYEDEEEDEQSGDMELPIVAMSSKPKDGDIREASCVCHHSYSGDRCQFFTLPVGRAKEGYSRTTALAVVAVVLSTLCLTIIGLLLALRRSCGNSTSK
ncbi:hypothetical protein NHX12_012042 [Muraenolepis orangiensis]|uniref:EGF-like domain-containing protein n=1 Tax=Muraenolepis orangiensis TaxID=630683 RepID=A0A9Q0DHE7_9TELE|nr:hypothetical protein NHX12_012042 [Muraenolepis orangiensis]